jgi:hypothetical protein
MLLAGFLYRRPETSLSIGLISTRNGTVPGFGGSDRALAKEALRERPVVIAPQY